MSDSRVEAHALLARAGAAAIGTCLVRMRANHHRAPKIQKGKGWMGWDVAHSQLDERSVHGSPPRKMFLIEFRTYVQVINNSSRLNTAPVLGVTARSSGICLFVWSLELVALLLLALHCHRVRVRATPRQRAIITSDRLMFVCYDYLNTSSQRLRG
jgi:hypothetical protein